jgi:hypothetical protein
MKKSTIVAIMLSLFSISAMAGNDKSKSFEDMSRGEDRKEDAHYFKKEGKKEDDKLFKGRDNHFGQHEFKQPCNPITTPVPEPTTMSLFVVGFGLIGMRVANMRRRARTSSKTLN